MDANISIGSVDLITNEPQVSVLTETLSMCFIALDGRAQPSARPAEVGLAKLHKSRYDVIPAIGLAVLISEPAPLIVHPSFLKSTDGKRRVFDDLACTPRVLRYRRFFVDTLLCLLSRLKTFVGKALGIAGKGRATCPWISSATSKPIWMLTRLI